MKSDDVRVKLEFALILITGIVSVAIATLDVTGLIDSNSWIAQRVPALTLLAVGFIASYLIMERRNRIDTLATSLETRSKEIMEGITSASNRTINALNGVEVLSFANTADLVTYASSRFKKASRIDDVTIGGAESQPRSSRDTTAYQDYQKTISEIAKRPDIIWREVTIFRSHDHFKREKERILEPSSVGYSLAYYEPSIINIPSIRGFAVIDNEEVFFSYTAKSVWFSIRHPVVARYFSAYFEDIWKDARKLKQGQSIDLQELKKAEVQFEETAATPVELARS